MGTRERYNSHIPKKEPHTPKVLSQRSEVGSITPRGFAPSGSTKLLGKIYIENRSSITTVQPSSVLEAGRLRRRGDTANTACSVYYNKYFEKIQKGLPITGKALKKKSFSVERGSLFRHVNAIAVIGVVFFIKHYFTLLRLDYRFCPRSSRNDAEGESRNDFAWKINKCPNQQQ